MADVLLEIRPEKPVGHQADSGLDARVCQSVELQSNGLTELQGNKRARSSAGQLTDYFCRTVRELDLAKTPLLPGVGVHELEQIRILLLSCC